MKELVSMLKRKEYGKAKGFLQKKLSQNPNDVYLLTQMANILWNLGKEEKALEYVNKAQERDPENPLTLFTKGRILWSIENYIEAIRIWDELLNSDMSDMAERGWGKRWAKSVINDARFYKADCQYCLHHIDEARSLVEEHLKYRQKGQESDFTLREARDFLRIITYSTENIFSNKSEIKGWATNRQWNRMEKIMEEKKEDVIALVAYIKKQIRNYPCEYYLKTRLSELLVDMGRNKESLRFAQEAYAQEPTDFLVAYNYGNALYHNGMYGEAMGILETITNADINVIAYGEHGEGMKWAQSLLRDAKKKIMLCKQENHV